MQYAVLTSSPQRPLPQKAPITRVISPANQFARREEDEYKITNPELLSDSPLLPEKQRFSYRFDYKISPKNSRFRNVNYNRKVPSRVPDFRAPVRRNLQ